MFDTPAPTPEDWTALDPAAAAAAFAERLPADLDPVTRAGAVSLVRAGLTLLEGMGHRQVTLPERQNKECNIVIRPAHNLALSPRSASSLEDVVLLQGEDREIILTQAAEVLADIASETGETARAELLEDALIYFKRGYFAIFPRTPFGDDQITRVQTVIVDALWQAREAERGREARLACSA